MKRPKTAKEVDELIIELLDLKDKFIRAGFYKTFHALDEASKIVGYEVADKLTKDLK